MTNATLDWTPFTLCRINGLIARARARRIACMWSIVIVSINRLTVSSGSHLVSTNGPYAFSIPTSHQMMPDRRPNDLTWRFLLLLVFSLSLSVFYFKFENEHNKWMFVACRRTIYVLKYMRLCRLCRILIFTMSIESTGSGVKPRPKEISYIDSKCVAVCWSIVNAFRMRSQYYFFLFLLLFRSPVQFRRPKWEKKIEKIYWWLSLEIIKFEWMCFSLRLSSIVRSFFRFDFFFFNEWSMTGLNLNSHGWIELRIKRNSFFFSLCAAQICE